eukprot:scaffold172164_cov66-Cyclotella_meneghiniana.AAC.1
MLRVFGNLTSIFDEVIGYQENDIFDLIIKFADADGFRHLNMYFESCTGATRFPSLDELSSILNLRELAVEGDGGKYYRGAVGLAEGIIWHLLSFTEEQLLQHGDDSVDICKRLSTIILKGLTYQVVSDYFDLLRELAFKLISSSSVPLKLLGYGEIQRMTEISATTFPPPQSYLVQDAGKDVDNGRFEFDPESLINGYNIFNACIVYTRTVPMPECGTILKLFKSHNNRYWFMWVDDKIRYVNYDTASNLPPSSGWETLTGNENDRTLTLTPIGAAVPAGKELSSLGNDCWSWIARNCVLELAAQDSGSSNSEIQKEAITAGHSMIHFIGEMLEKVTKIMKDQSKPSQVLCNAALKIFTEVVETLLVLSDEAFINIIPDFMMKTSDQLRAIVNIISISTLDRQHMFDYLVFHRLLLLRLMFSTGSPMYYSPMFVIEAIPGAKLTNSLPEAYTVEGALPSRFNGRYTLKKCYSESSTRFVTYVKRYYNSSGTVDIMQIQQCLFGPEKGIWSISQHNESDSDTTVTRYFVNMSTNAGLPPETGWALQPDSGSWSAPTLTAVGTSSAESVQQEQEIHESFDASSLHMSEQQSKLWKFVQELSDLVENLEPDRTNNKEAVQRHQASLNMLELSSINRVFVKCAEMVLNHTPTITQPILRIML